MLEKATPDSPAETSALTRSEFVEHFASPLRDLALSPGTPAARELLARPRRFERPTFAAGAFTHSPIEQYPVISRALPLAGVWSIEAHRRP
jgi:hypothetical protein